MKISQILKLYYQALSLVNIFTFKNKYFIALYILLAFISFIFNNNIEGATNFFKDLDLNNYSFSNFKLYIILLIMLYLSTCKFNLIIKILSILRSIPFFYKEQQVYRKDLKFIMWIYYNLNFFFILILLIIINNITNNLYSINEDIGIFTNYYTNISSILLTLIFFKYFLAKQFYINNNSNALSIIILNIILTFGPFIFFNLLANSSFLISSELKNKFVSHFTVYCDSIGSNNFQDKIKETDNISSPNISSEDKGKSNSFIDSFKTFKKNITEVLSRKKSKSQIRAEDFYLTSKNESDSSVPTIKQVNYYKPDNIDINKDTTLEASTSYSVPTIKQANDYKPDNIDINKDNTLEASTSSSLPTIKEANDYKPDNIDINKDTTLEASTSSEAPWKNPASPDLIDEYGDEFKGLFTSQSKGKGKAK
uniref:Uncharacterized protein n=1 Tax=Lyophyllum shimeji TaxID=47721 RepID=A0A2Z4HHA4_LYOSH|nr:hypothetical protein [Lyophyllum shimeji]AWW14113.1 hypothetical protein [Lyophyllum shimeji]